MATATSTDTSHVYTTCILYSICVDARKYNYMFQMYNKIISKVDDEHILVLS